MSGRYRHLPLLVILVALGWTFRESPALTEVLAGIAIFLFGMMALEQGFKALTGGTLERLLKHSTNRLWKALTFGAAATTLTQSSSLVSVITISFLSAGMMSLNQGIGVIFGANLGTTSGAWLMAGFGIRVNISAYALPLLTVGVVLVFNRSRALKGIGYVLTGIGFLFLGIHYMKEGFEAFQQNIDLSQYAVAGVGGLLLYTALGILATVIMQSSHATLILTITALSVGHITYDNALALSVGANVGTTVTALLGALGANIEGRRLAGAHLIFNLSVGLLALVFMPVFLAAVEGLSGLLGIGPDNHSLKLALFHTLFNLVGIVLMVPLIPRMVELLETRMKPRPLTLDEPEFMRQTMLEIPAAALEATRRELVRLFGRAFSVMAQVLNFEPGQLRRLTDRARFMDAPERLRPVDVDDLYRRRIKPLHGQILNYLTRIPVRDQRARQLVLLRVASQELVEAVKDTKHLQKNLLAHLHDRNPDLRNEYLQIRAHLGYLLANVEGLINGRSTSEDVPVRLAELDALIESADIVGSGRLDQLIREDRIDAEQATSLMNDNGYCYRIGRNLVSVARAIQQPFEDIDAELREALSLDPEETRRILADVDHPPGTGHDSDQGISP